MKTLTTTILSIVALAGALVACGGGGPVCTDAAVASTLPLPDGGVRRWPQPQAERSMYRLTSTNPLCPAVPPASGETCTGRDRRVCSYDRTCGVTLLCSCGGLVDDWACDELVQ